MTFRVVGDLFREAFYEFGPFRPGTHKAHIAFKDIPHLRQLVQTVFAQHPADAGDAFVLFGGPAGSADTLCVVDHRTKFKYLKSFAVFTETRLPEKDRARRIQFDGNYCKNRHRERKNQTGRGQNGTGQSFGKPGKRRLAKPLGKNKPAGVQSFYEKLSR